MPALPAFSSIPLLRNPNNKSQLLISVVSRDFPASESWKVNADHHKWLVWLYPAIVSTVRGKKGSKRIEPPPCYFQLRLRFSVPVVSLPPPKGGTNAWVEGLVTGHVSGILSGPATSDCCARDVCGNSESRQNRKRRRGNIAPPVSRLFYIVNCRSQSFTPPIEVHPSEPLMR